MKKINFNISAQRLSKNFLLAQIRVLYTTMLKMEKKMEKGNNKKIALQIMADTIEELKQKTKVINKNKWNM